MTTLAELQRLITDHWIELQGAYKLKRLAFFGSYARGEQTPASDVDVLVEFSGPVGFEFVHLADHLEHLFGLPVDLVTPDAIKPNRRELILADLVDAQA
jgi:hypothetical protein